MKCRTNGLSFADIRGYKDWQTVVPSHTDATNVMRLIVANPVKPFPEGSKIAKTEWRPKKVTRPEFFASSPDTVPGDLAAVEVIEEGRQAIPGHARLGVYHIRVSRRSRYIHTSHQGQQATAGARR